MTAKQTADMSTPRPWITGPTGIVMQGYSQPLAIAKSDGSTLIAGVFGDVKGGEETAKANAALIVRAVNSHQELVEVLEQCVRVLQGSVTPPIYRASALEKARIALLNATKDQP